MLESRKWARAIGLAILFLAAGLVVYSGIVSTFFVSDDFVLLQRLRSEPSGAWSNIGGYSFFPLMSLLLFGEGQMWGLATPGYHLVSITLHVLTSLCVCLVVLLLTQARGKVGAGMTAVALLAGLWFLVSPSHTEAVSWVSARSHVLAALFGLLSLASYIAHRLYGRRSLFLLSLACFAAALLSKEGVITLPVMVLVFDLVLCPPPGNLGQRRAEILGRFLTFCGMALLYLALRQWYLRGLTAGLTAPGNEAPGIVTLVGNLARQISRAILPPMSGFALAAGVFFIALVLAVLLARLFTVRRGQGGTGDWQLLLFLGLSYVVSTLPYLPFHVAVTDTQGERYLYWPGAFLIMAMAALLYNILGNGRPLRVFLATVIVVSAVVLFRQNQNWIEAAGISETVVSDVCTLSGGDTIVIANVPDNVRGAYVLRNGLWHALQLYCPQSGRARDVAVLSTHAVSSAADASIMRKVDQATFEIHVPAPFVQKPGVSGRPALLLAITAVTARSYRLSVRAEEDHALIIFYSAGRMHLAP